MARNGRRRIPAGWKYLEGRWWCAACTRERFVLRAVALPVSGPVDGSWAELRDALHTAFAETTRCANWLVTELYARDAKREPADARLRAMPRVYLYPEARQLFPGARVTDAGQSRTTGAGPLSSRAPGPGVAARRQPADLALSDAAAGAGSDVDARATRATLVSVGPPRRSPMAAAAAAWTGDGASASPARSGGRGRHRRRRGHALRGCRASR